MTRMSGSRALWRLVLIRKALVGREHKSRRSPEGLRSAVLWKTLLMYLYVMDSIEPVFQVLCHLVEFLEEKKKFKEYQR